MKESEKATIMAETAQNLISMIQNRLNSRVEALNTLSTSSMESIPDKVKEMRETEAIKIRAVMQEQKDLIEIIKILFPVP